MVLIYKHVSGSQQEKPLEVDENLSQYVTYVRKNIMECTDENGEHTGWEYDEAILSKEDYQRYISEREDAIWKQGEEIDELRQALLEIGEVVYG